MFGLSIVCEPAERPLHPFGLSEELIQLWRSNVKVTLTLINMSLVICQELIDENKDTIKRPRRRTRYIR